MVSSVGVTIMQYYCLHCPGFLLSSLKFFYYLSSEVLLLSLKSSSGNSLGACMDAVHNLVFRAPASIDVSSANNIPAAKAANNPCCIFSHAVHKHILASDILQGMRPSSPVLLILPGEISWLVQCCFDKSKGLLRAKSAMKKMLGKLDFRTSHRIKFICAGMFMVRHFKSPCDLYEEPLMGNHWAFGVCRLTVEDEYMCYADGLGYPPENARVYSLVFDYIRHHVLKCYAAGIYVHACLTDKDRDSIINGWQRKHDVHPLFTVRQPDEFNCGIAVLSYFAAFLIDISNMDNAGENLSLALPRLIDSKIVLAPDTFRNADAIRASIIVHLMFLTSPLHIRNENAVCCSPIFLLSNISSSKYVHAFGANHGRVKDAARTLVKFTLLESPLSPSVPCHVLCSHPHGEPFSPPWCTVLAVVLMSLPPFSQPRYTVSPPLIHKYTASPTATNRTTAE